MLGIKHIKVDGTETDLGRAKLTLQAAQALVSTGTPHGIIEFTRLKDHPDKYKVGGHVMVVHEEGLLYNLPVNQKACELADNYIVGDVIIIENEASDF